MMDNLLLINAVHLISVVNTLSLLFRKTILKLSFKVFFFGFVEKKKNGMVIFHKLLNTIYKI